MLPFQGAIIAQNALITNSIRLLFLYFMSSALIFYSHFSRSIYLEVILLYIDYTMSSALILLALYSVYVHFALIRLVEFLSRSIFFAHFALVLLLQLLSLSVQCTFSMQKSLPSLFTPDEFFQLNFIDFGRLGEDKTQYTCCAR